MATGSTRLTDFGFAGYAPLPLGAALADGTRIGLVTSTIPSTTLS